MKTLLLCGYRACDPSEPLLGTAAHADDGATLLDHRIRQLRALRHDVICVLAGAKADEVLRLCPRIQETELVFDTNEPTNLMSNLRAGTFAVPNQACFVLPLEVPLVRPEVWEFLRNEYGKLGFATAHGFLRLESAPYGFPLLLSRQGVKQLTASTPIQQLNDPALNPLVLTLPNTNSSITI